MAGNSIGDGQEPVQPSPFFGLANGVLYQFSGIPVVVVAVVTIDVAETLDTFASAFEISVWGLTEEFIDVDVDVDVVVDVVVVDVDVEVVEVDVEDVELEVIVGEVLVLVKVLVVFKVVVEVLEGLGIGFSGEAGTNRIDEMIDW